jgi:ribosomal protein S18 acetylase RimI-like enzyme
MTHILDRPIFSALATRQAAVAQGGALAKRYDPAIVPFAAAREESAQCLAALGDLAAPGDTLVLLQADPIVLPNGFTATLTAEGVQLVLKRPPSEVADARIEPLGLADAPAMLELATMTKPGPFTLKAQALGEFFGAKENGRLIAMAGERMKQHGFTEISGVCTHPGARGRGLARLLSIFMAHRVLQRGETPYLHAFATNTAAVKLYESIGFELRAMVNVAAIQREATPRRTPSASRRRETAR